MNISSRISSFQNLPRLLSECVECLNQQLDVSQTVDELVPNARNRESERSIDLEGFEIGEASADAEELKIVLEQVKTPPQKLKNQKQLLEDCYKQFERQKAENAFQQLKDKEELEISQEQVKTLQQQLNEEKQLTKAEQKHLEYLEHSLHALRVDKLCHQHGGVELLKEHLKAIASTAVMNERGKKGNLLIDGKDRFIVRCALNKFINVLLD